MREFRRSAYQALWTAPVRGVLARVPLVRRLYGGWRRAHPFDAVHGVDTSGFLSAAECAGEAGLGEQISPYGGSQPSIVRQVLASLPDIGAYACVDLGCGKGRPLVVASEFPFRRLVGVELAPALAQVARANAAVIAARHPGRTPIEIEVGDATNVTAPASRVVYFMYHAFDAALVRALVETFERQLAAGLEHAFFVYYNPVHGAVADASPHFRRWSAQTLDYARDELGYGPDISDTVVVWQSVPERYAACAGADRAIVQEPGERCHLA